MCFHVLAHLSKLDFLNTDLFPMAVCSISLLIHAGVFLWGFGFLEVVGLGWIGLGVFFVLLFVFWFSFVFFLGVGDIFFSFVLGLGLLG